MKVRVLRDQPMPPALDDQDWAKETAQEVLTTLGITALEPGRIVEIQKIDSYGTALMIHPDDAKGIAPWYLPEGWYEVVYE